MAFVLLYTRERLESIHRILATPIPTSWLDLHRLLPSPVLVHSVT
jgi:hypothetical protein